MKINEKIQTIVNSKVDRVVACTPIVHLFKKDWSTRVSGCKKEIIKRFALKTLLDQKQTGTQIIQICGITDNLVWTNSNLYAVFSSLKQNCEICIIRKHGFYNE